MTLGSGNELDPEAERSWLPEKGMDTYQDIHESRKEYKSATDSLPICQLCRHSRIVRYCVLSGITNRGGERSGLWWNYHIVTVLLLCINLIASSSSWGIHVRARAGARSRVRVIRNGW